MAIKMIRICCQCWWLGITNVQHYEVLICAHNRPNMIFDVARIYNTNKLSLVRNNGRHLPQGDADQIFNSAAKILKFNSILLRDTGSECIPLSMLKAAGAKITAVSSS